jgi:phospholipid/cholesterol/gamma-HCH transport system substrate-binding protein
MRRLALICLALAGIAVAVVLATSLASGGSGGYVVAAVFDNSGAIVPGEDVDVAGATVGTVQSLDLTRGYKAVVNLHITDRQFIPFHRDAYCTIRSEGVLAVEFVDCDTGTSGSPALVPGAAGPHELPVQQTSSPVEFDLVTNIYREPAGEYLATLLDEFGTGLAAQGSDLNAVIRRANPGLAETDQVLQVLDRQNAVLRHLAVK